MLEVDDLDAAITELRGADVAFRNTVETGPVAGRSSSSDPDGNPVELFEAAAAVTPRAD